jgi:alpha-aminoadipate carrier protein LysW
MREGTPSINARQRAIIQNQEAEKMIVRCPKCKSDIDVGEEELEEGELVSCLECDGDFEVASVEPLKLAKVIEEEEADEEDE